MNAVIYRAITNITGIPGTLLAGGATRILVPGMPHFGLTPSFAADPSGVTAAAEGFNAGLQSALGGSLPPGSWQSYDTFGFLRAAVANPAAYGFTNVTDSCVDTPACIGNPATWNQYLFWDSLHPTTSAHGFLGAEFAHACLNPRR